MNAPSYALVSCRTPKDIVRFHSCAFQRYWLSWLQVGVGLTDVNGYSTELVRERMLSDRIQKGLTASRGWRVCSLRQDNEVSASTASDSVQVFGSWMSGLGKLVSFQCGCFRTMLIPTIFVVIPVNSLSSKYKGHVRSPHLVVLTWWFLSCCYWPWHDRNWARSN
jgi:hypothetical protein